MIRTVVLIYISLIIRNVEHLFQCLLAIYIISSEKCLLMPSAHFSIELFVFLLLSCMSYLYILEIYTCQSHHLQIFSPILWVVFILFIVSFAVEKLVSLTRSHLFTFVFISITLGD